MTWIYEPDQVDPELTEVAILRRALATALLIADRVKQPTKDGLRAARLKAILRKHR